MKRKILLFLGFAVISVGFCVLEFWRYANSFETIIPYEHFFLTVKPEDEIYLDLNEASASQLAKLPNVSRPLADRIVAYRKELGGFTTIKQLLDIPEMPESLYLSLGEYVYLTPKAETEPSETERPSETSAAISTEPDTTEILMLNLNTATAEELCLLPEIGEKTAEAIVTYRTQIGGFFNKLQLLEISGIGEMTYRVIECYVYVENERPIPETIPTEIPETQPYIPESTEPFMINLNTASVEDLLKLPDCSESTAQEILVLRNNLHGFSNTLEINFAESVTTELYLKWESYLAVDEYGNKEKEPAS